ncbi:MAG: hypothetical protein M1556_03520 [Candidatus Thermoplasmatota archaeon]|jgi:hypothetical protein|nr:hypothetical protein [Candidatus Thermoplasmatota archaeon]MCL6002694.1 hypothetical protein [Candidatus Thermoplasmatota archaeon]
MKRHIRISYCPVCGHRANTSKWWTRAKSGKTYHYFRYYHSVKKIHFVPTNSTYSISPDVRKIGDDLNAKLQDFIYRRMGTRAYSFTSFKKEFERFCGRSIHNESFSRQIDKAISSQLIKKKHNGNKSTYEREPKPKLDEEMEFDKFAIHYGVKRNSMKISTFLIVTNVGKLPIDHIPLYVPYEIVDSVGKLNLQISTESDEIPSTNAKVIVSNALETVLSIPLARSLKHGEQEFVFVVYEIPKINSVLKLVTKAKIGLLRVSVSTPNSSEVETVRTLVDGAKEVRTSFQHKDKHTEGSLYLYSEFEDILKGECISIRFRSIN